MGGGGAQRAKRVAYPPGLKKSQRDAIRRKRNRDCAQRIRDRQASDITMLEQQAAAVQQQQEELLRRHQQLEAANAELRRAGQAEMRALLQMLQAQERDSGSFLADAAPMIDPATLAQMAATMGVDLNEPPAPTSATTNNNSLRRDSVSSSVSSNNSQSSNGRADSAILMDDTPTSATATASAAADSVSSADLWKAAGAQVLLEYSPAASGSSGSNGSNNDQGSPITPSAAVASSESNNSSLSPGLEAGSLMDWSADMLFGLLPPTTEAAAAGVAEVSAAASASASADGAFSKPPRPSESLSFLDEYLQYDMVREAAWPQSVPLFVARPQLQQPQVPQAPQQPARFQTPLHQQFWWQRLQWLQQRQRQLQLQQQKPNQLPPQFWLPPPPRHPDHAAQMQIASASSSSSSSSSMQLLDQPSAHWQAAAAAAATQQGAQGLGSQHLSSHHYNMARDLDVLPFDDAPVLPSLAEDDVETDEEGVKKEEEESAAVEARGFWTFGSLCGSSESSEEKQMCRGKRILRGIWRHCPAIKLLRLLMVLVLVPICRAAIRIVGKPAARVAAWAEEHKLPAAGAKNRLPASNWVDLAFAALTSLAALLTIATAWLPQPQWKPRDPSDHSQQQQQNPPTKPRKAHHTLRHRQPGFTPSFPSFSHSFMSSSSAHEAVELLLLQLLLPLQNLAGVVVV
eukprot:m.10072 g.10072  ORF g.10072 m.10072 type:complete len:685 (-) comp5119_c0_seq1:1419-3473(-)